MKFPAAYSCRHFIIYAAAWRGFTTVKSSKLNDTVLTNLPKYSNPVRAYLHQICGGPEPGFPVRQEKLWACAVCELLAELLALKRFNSVKSQQRLLPACKYHGPNGRRSVLHRGGIF